jgi:hypothetical protein
LLPLADGALDFVRFVSGLIIMKPKYCIVVLGILFGAPFCALAQTEETGAPQTSTSVNLLMTLLPIILIGGFFWWLLRRVVSKNQKRSDEYIAIQKQHMEKVEQTLERIAKAVEKKDKDVV